MFRLNCFALSIFIIIISSCSDDKEAELSSKDSSSQLIENIDLPKHLGLKEGEKLEDGFKIKYETINASVDSEGQIVDFGGSDTASVEAIIYDRNGNVVAVQTCRSKSGPGGSVNDTINWHPDYQKCMAEHTITNGKCG